MLTPLFSCDKALGLFGNHWAMLSIFLTAKSFNNKVQGKRIERPRVELHPGSRGTRPDTKVALNGNSSSQSLAKKIKSKSKSTTKGTTDKNPGNADNGPVPRIEG